MKPKCPACGGELEPLYHVDIAGKKVWKCRKCGREVYDEALK